MHKFIGEGSELVTNCYQFKLPAADGKQRLTDVANAETLLRIVQSVPSPKADGNLLIAIVQREKLLKLKSVARLFKHFEDKINEYVAV